MISKPSSNKSNAELTLAEEYIRETGCNIFLTGKAGTGKTTFLHTLKANCPKRHIVTAPTGVAAINAGGVTLHSFFQLPFGPISPGSMNSRSQYRFSKDKIALIKSMDLLVIDEVSMVRADLLDGVDNVLRRFRRSEAPFGGVQLLMIGDLFQLPPVVKNDEWHLLRQHYSSPFFFSSIALAKTELVTIELQQIFRQADSNFINILNKVRNNNLDAPSLQKLNERVTADVSQEDAAGVITLCTHNKNADDINSRRLAQLSPAAIEFEADVEGEFPEHTFPAAYSLELKKGAQVMFVRNDLSDEQRFFNGKIGTITKISNSSILVRCPEDNEAIEVEPATWENIEYSLNEETQEITEKKIGAFIQYPLRLAWAITIHKSQGLTFDKAVIDAQAAFAHGQVYVALSRCRTLEGLTLSSPLSPQAVQTDRAVLQFSSESSKNSPTPANLRTSRIRYQQQLLLECFDFNRLRSLLRRTVSLILGNQGVIKVSGAGDLKENQEKFEEQIYTVSGNFQRQLFGCFKDTILPTDDPHIVERISKASHYFDEKISAILLPLARGIILDTDNKELRKKTKNIKGMLEEEIAVKHSSVKCCDSGFSPAQYFRAISAAAVLLQRSEKKKAAVVYTESDIDHPELFSTLKEWRGRKAQEGNLAHFQVMHQKTLVQIVVNLPVSLMELKKLSGIGDKTIEKYGDELIEIVKSYREEHNIEAVILPTVTATTGKPSKSATPAVDTKKMTLDLFNEGLTPLEIAERRQLALATIEKHLAYHIEMGTIAVSSLIKPENLATLVQQIDVKSEKSLKEIKDSISVEATYGEIKYVLANLKKKA